MTGRGGHSASHCQLRADLALELADSTEDIGPKKRYLNLAELWTALALRAREAEQALD
jgi:hypothetical protein